MTILSKVIYIFGIVPIKIPGPFHRHRKIILKCTWKKRPQIVESNFEEKNTRELSSYLISSTTEP